MHRILLFSGKPYAIYSFGFMLVMAMAVGVAYMIRRAPRFGMTRDQVLDLALAVLLGGMVGARVYMVVTDWAHYAENPVQMFNIRAGGLAWHGSIIGGFIGFFLYQWRAGIDRGRLTDLLTPPIIVGHILGRIGCFLNGCCVGRQCSVPWGVTFPDAPEWGGVVRHPTQIYEALCELAVLLFITRVWERRMRWRGSSLYLYLSCYAVIRFGVDFFRQEPLLAGGLDEAQYLSILLLVVGLIGLVRSARASVAAVADDATRPAASPLSATAGG